MHESLEQVRELPLYFGTNGMPKVNKRAICDRAIYDNNQPPKASHKTYSTIEIARYKTSIRHSHETMS